MSHPGVLPASLPSRIQAVLFDLDGVLVSSYEAWFHVQNDVASKLGYPPILRPRYDAAWGQSVEADVESFYPKHSAKEVRALYERLFPEHLRHVVANEEARAVLHRLSDGGVGTAVVTNSPRAVAEQVLEDHRLPVDLVIGGADVPRAKPAPDMLLLACKRLGSPPITLARSRPIPPQAVIMVGDSRFDREAAAAAGIFFVGLGTAGDITIESLADLLHHFEVHLRRRSDPPLGLR